MYVLSDSEQNKISNNNENKGLIQLFDLLFLENNEKKEIIFDFYERLKGTYDAFVSEQNPYKSLQSLS